MASTIGTLEITDRVVSVFTGSEFETDLVSIRTKYGLSVSDLPQMTIENRNVFRYETLGVDGATWPYLMVLFDGDDVVQWARADQAVERATFRLIFGYKMPGKNHKELRSRLQAYIDAAKRTCTRAIRDNAGICDSRYTGSSYGSTFTGPTTNSLVQYATLNVDVDYYTTTETT